MRSENAWFLDVYDDPDDDLVTLWCLTENKQRIKLKHELKVKFYVHGPHVKLREVWQYLKQHPINPKLSRTSKRDIFYDEPLDLLAIEVISPQKQRHLYRDLVKYFPELTYYDADIKTTIRFAAKYGSFPLCQCKMTYFDDGLIDKLEVLSSPWELDPAYPDMRILRIKPDIDPARGKPKALLLAYGQKQLKINIHPTRSFLVELQAILKRYDPDLILSQSGDTWMLPWLQKISNKWHIPLSLNRDDSADLKIKPERSYYSYGQIIYSGQQVHLRGRWHIDAKNAMFWDDYALEGVYETARVTGQSIQEAARTSPGTGISSMQIQTALRHDILVPLRKQQAEKPRDALELIQADRGGMIYQPIVGLHRDVGAIDFVSMYPAIMVRCNISPETKNIRLLEASEEPQGLIPKTLEPLLRKRVSIKQRLGTMHKRDCRYEIYKARSSAHKWLLVTCFGYLGYKNAKWGRIEAHEAVTAGGREALLRAKEASEDLGYDVLHMYVDGLWIQNGKNKAADFDKVLNEIVDRTGLSISLDGIFKWIAFLPSRVNQNAPVPNRYFGVYQDGSLKIRGIETRRKDTSVWVKNLQMNLLEHLAQAENADALPSYMPGALHILRQQITALFEGTVPMQDLLMAFRLSREPDEYRVKTAGARAAKQLLDIGKETKPGQRVRLVFLRGKQVHAWDLPYQPDPRMIDKNYYFELALRAASTVFFPMGLHEQDLRDWLKGGIQLRLKFPLNNTSYLLPQETSNPAKLITYLSGTPQLPSKSKTSREIQEVFPSNTERFELPTLGFKKRCAVKETAQPQTAQIHMSSLPIPSPEAVTKL